MSDRPFRLSDWNDILTRVNAMGDCVSPKLQLVVAPRLMLKKDVVDVQNVLRSACSRNVFTPLTTPQLNFQHIIDEINAAIANGCCDSSPGIDIYFACSEVRFTVMTISVSGTHVDSVFYGDLSHYGGGCDFHSEPYSLPDDFDPNAHSQQEILLALAAENDLTIDDDTEITGP